ncbi:MAG TPA: septal ring lytic transglycosylase RlpA family protein [Conexibacter sp.]|nr:septal ring lytic transglycosylase RlpA family protein [Conexibacter sp.]
MRARPRHAAIGALALGTALSTTAFALAEDPPAATGGAPAVTTPSADAGAAAKHRHRRYDGKLVLKRHDYKIEMGVPIHVRGVLFPRRRGRQVVVEAGKHGRWKPLAHALTRANGHFDVRLAVNTLSSVRLRVHFSGDRRADGDRARAGTLQTFRSSLASWYALYGGALACGGTLGYDTLGVANKTLPCGTRVTLRYHGRQVTVPVIDRGPYVGGREWDLTGATARRLGFGGTGVVWSSR